MGINHVEEMSDEKKRIDGHVLAVLWMRLLSRFLKIIPLNSSGFMVSKVLAEKPRSLQIESGLADFAGHIATCAVKYGEGTVG